jgi:Zn-dependent protease
MLAGTVIAVFAIVFTLFVHEAGHILAILLTRAGKVQGMVVCLKGIGVKWEPYGHDPFKRSVVSLSGSAINLALAIVFYSAGLEMLGMANLVFGLINLMPLPGADGLRAFNSLKEAVS